MIAALEEQLKETQKAVSQFKLFLKGIQENCPHKKVLQSNWRSGEFFGPFYGHRICLDCGLEEKCSSAWDNDGGYVKLKTDGFHKEVSAEEIYKHRIPFDDRTFL